MKVRLAEGGEPWGLTFDLILIDGFENGEWPTNVQVDDSQDQISLASDFGWPGYDPAKENGEGEHGQAYNFLKANIGKVIDDPGYFDAIPHGPYKHCNTCGGFHRLGYGGECINTGQRFLWDSNKGKMIVADVAKRWAKIEVVVDYPCTIPSEEAFDEWMRALDKVQTPSGVIPRYSTLKSVHTTDPSEGAEAGEVKVG